MTKTCTIRAVTINTFLQRSIFQFMILHMKPLVTHNLEIILQQRWMNTVHLGKVWNPLLTLSTINLERKVDTRKIFHPNNH